MHWPTSSTRIFVAMQHNTYVEYSPRNPNLVSLRRPKLHQGPTLLGLDDLGMDPATLPSFTIFADPASVYTGSNKPVHGGTAGPGKENIMRLKPVKYWLPVL